MDSKQPLVYDKRGYLHKNFALFHLKDKKKLPLEYHFHDFSKIIVFLSGQVTYMIEGKKYQLKPHDILLVNNHEIHQPLIDSTVTYERIIIWFQPSFAAAPAAGADLLTCFQLAAKNHNNRLRLAPDQFVELNNLFLQLETADRSSEFGSQALKNSLFIQIMVHLNRRYLKQQTDGKTADILYDETIDQLLKYINAHLAEDLTIDYLAAFCHLNKYYLMRKFKNQTGYTLHGYIRQKRLITAGLLLKQGKSVTQACLECGFNDYSNFIRSFKELYGLSPKQHGKTERLPLG